jgi:hypothetical protein
MLFDLRETIQRQMFLGAYEPEQPGWFRECLGPGDIVIEIGASFGYYTTLGSALVGPSGKVFAFEPNPVSGLRRQRPRFFHGAGSDDILGLLRAAKNVSKVKMGMKGSP